MRSACQNMEAHIETSMDASQAAHQDPLSERSLTVRYVRHPAYLEAVVEGFVSPEGGAFLLRSISRECRETRFARVLIDLRLVIGQLTQADHERLGELIGELFGSVRVAAIAPPGRPVGEIAPSAQRRGASYLGVRTHIEA